jgi:large subunit ribosomal protein L10
MANLNSAVRAAKTDEIAMIRAGFDKAVSTVFLDFRGLTVIQATELRKRFREKGIQYVVVKNSLVEKALVGSPLEGNAQVAKYLKGPTGIAWSFEDPSLAAKIVKAFRKEDPKNEEKLNVKGGVLESTFFDGANVEAQLAILPGKDEVRAMLLATLQAPASALVRLLVAPATQVVCALDAKSKL